MTHEVDCGDYIDIYVDEPYCYGANCTEAENEKFFEDENDYCSFYSDDDSADDSAASSLGLSSVLVSVAMSGLWWLYNL